MCLEAPKFGNDDDFVDEQVAWVTHMVTEVSLGQTLNLKLDPEVFETDDGFKRLADLIRVFVD